MPALQRGGRALSLSPKQRTLYFGVHAAVVAARLLRYFSNKGYSEVCPRARNESPQPERGSRQGFSRDISLEQGSQGQRP